MKVRSVLFLAIADQLAHDAIPLTPRRPAKIASILTIDAVIDPANLPQCVVDVLQTGKACPPCPQIGLGRQVRTALDMGSVEDHRLLLVHQMEGGSCRPRQVRIALSALSAR
jgi:hypothetical protein